MRSAEGTKRGLSARAEREAMPGNLEPGNGFLLLGRSAGASACWSAFGGAVACLGFFAFLSGLGFCSLALGFLPGELLCFLRASLLSSLASFLASLLLRQPDTCSAPWETCGSAFLFPRHRRRLWRRRRLRRPCGRSQPSSLASTSALARPSSEVLPVGLNDRFCPCRPRRPSSSCPCQVCREPAWSWDRCPRCRPAWSGWGWRRCRCSRA